MNKEITVLIIAWVLLILGLVKGNVSIIGDAIIIFTLAYLLTNGEEKE